MGRALNLSQFQHNVTDGTTTVATTYVTNGSAKVWVNFDGSGTIATRDSNNVSSLTDDGTGKYTVNISNNMANDDFAALNYNSGSTASSQTAFNNGFLGGNGNAVGSFKMSSYTAFFEDCDLVMATVHGDLA